MIGPRSIRKSLRFSFVEWRLLMVPSRKSASVQPRVSRKKVANSWKFHWQLAIYKDGFVGTRSADAVAEKARIRVRIEGRMDPAAVDEHWSGLGREKDAFLEFRVVACLYDARLFR
jgi:uncharacterized protein with FMN-binding domain